jgi:hypothetical protein
VLVPEGWELRGGIVWTPGLKPFVHSQFGMVAPDGRELWFLPGRSYSFSEVPPGMVQAGHRSPEQGQPQLDGSIWMAPPKDLAEYVAKHVVPTGRPEAKGLRVVEVTHLEEVERAYRELLAPSIQQLEQQNRMMAQQGLASEMLLRVESVAVEYREGDVRYREEIPVMMFGTRMVTPDTHGYMGGPLVHHMWRATPFMSARAPAGSYEANEPLFATLARNVRPTMEWQVQIHELHMAISRMEHEGRMADQREFARRQKQIADTHSEISDMQMAGWRERQASEDRVHRSFVNTVGGVDDFRTPDGSSVSLPSDYDHVFTDSQGNYILTNDAFFEPARHAPKGDWKPIEPIRPSGGAATDR